ncbi:MAG: peptide chain release factor N(5)-glutamine methyltransferase [Deltaproteobacteria bacterium]|nr:peptide chain release factor N(5)-glutamine methyltransferase [Deltaproteobacteria bacterium]
MTRDRAEEAGDANEPWTIARVLRWSADDLKQRGSTSPRLDAELLLARVLGCDRVRLVIDAMRPLATEELLAYRELHKRRRRGEPVAYLLGEREFHSRTFVVDRRALVPRPETEHLVEVALERTRDRSLSARVLDLCTGSGCVAITVKKERPTNSVHASDTSPGALAVARENALRLGALVAFVESDGFAALGHLAGKLDLVTANPPYIPDANHATLPIDVRDFEPRLALTSGPEGLDVTRRIVSEAPRMLAPGGLLAIEIDAPSAAAVVALFNAAGFREVQVTRDYAGRDRIVSGRRG